MINIVLVHEIDHGGDAPGRTPHPSPPSKSAKTEAVAFVVCEVIGLETEAAFSDYIAVWNGDANLLRESLEAVQQTAAVILGDIAPEPAALAANA